MAVKVGMVSLGCAKNQVDGEMLMAALKSAGFETVDDAALADVAIVNTCGFIESAKKESIDEILELAQLKKEGRIKKLVVTGCLSERSKPRSTRSSPKWTPSWGSGLTGMLPPWFSACWKGSSWNPFPEKKKYPCAGTGNFPPPAGPPI